MYVEGYKKHLKVAQGLRLACKVLMQDWCISFNSRMQLVTDNGWWDFIDFNLNENEKFVQYWSRLGRTNVEQQTGRPAPFY